ncbi:MAG: hypothetical protein KKF89_02455, partial [Nanoarchaeota archaeon]|nr:hypothetical protein [Nanoarchaeota archaeon]
NLYNSIHHLYYATEFVDSKSQLDARNAISCIYAKIVLFIKLNECTSLLESRNLEKLGDSLRTVESLLNANVNETSYFYSYAKMLFNHLTVSAIGLGHISLKSKQSELV